MPRKTWFTGGGNAQAMLRGKSSRPKFVHNSDGSNDGKEEAKEWNIVVLQLIGFEAWTDLTLGVISEGGDFCSTRGGKKAPGIRPYPPLLTKERATSASNRTRILARGLVIQI